MIVFFWVM